MPGTKARVLLVDDDADYTQALKEYLEATGAYTVLTENEAERAVAAAVGFQPDAILLDLAMPGLDGGAVAAQLKAEPSLQSVPIIFITVVLSPLELAQRDGRLEGYRCLAKPARVEQVLACLEEALAP